MSPAELLFGRKIRTKLPEFREDRVASEVKDRDGEMKAKAKLYADKKRHTEDLNLVPGDRVLIKQEKENKLSTTFAPEPYDVVSRNGSSIIIKSPEGVQLKRNTAHVKTYEESPQVPSRTVSLPVKEDVQAQSPTLPTDLETDGGKESNAVSTYFVSVIIELRDLKSFTLVVQLRSLFWFSLVVSKFALCFPL